MREFYVKLLYLFYPALIIYGFSQGVSTGPGPRTAEHAPAGYEPAPTVVNTKPDPWDDEVHATHTSDTFLENFREFPENYNGSPETWRHNNTDDRWDTDFDNDGVHDHYDTDMDNDLVHDNFDRDMDTNYRD